MAYNPSLYNPYGQPQPYSWSQPNWYYQPSQATTQPVNGLVSVTGTEGAKAYQLPPNSSMPLFDKDNDILYVKTTDAAGYPTLKAFRFEPMEQEQAPRLDYVPRSEFDALAAKVDELVKPKPRARKAVNDGE